eukprot:comp23618_c7_seq1/m.40211 comp23618_c7_seq1/g.40211  ORF comp23618_c7_seq1/g.40211 comp23618_c7_seq1/m.40211 type:complete len:461 (-) comp23618_c7_seq1:255-1637(-)
MLKMVSPYDITLTPHLRSVERSPPSPPPSCLYIDDVPTFITNTSHTTSEGRKGARRTYSALPVYHAPIRLGSEKSCHYMSDLSGRNSCENMGLLSPVYHMKSSAMPDESHTSSNISKTNLYPANFQTKSALCRIEHYVLGEEIGSGCFARVVKVEHVLTGASVAIKVIDKSNPQYKGDMIGKEVEAMKRARGHPNIVELYEVIEEEELLYLVMEYIPGGNLHNYLSKNGAVSEEQARKWFGQLVGAVQHCHDVGVISRDVKNANVLVDETTNSVKLADFGLAAVMGIGESAHSARLWSATGSAVFAAPEVYGVHHGVGYFGPPAEVWALGCILHSCLTVPPPFDMPQSASQWHNYVPPRGVSMELRVLLSSIFSFEPSLRPTTQEILSHPWVKAGTELPRLPFSPVAQPNASNGWGAVRVDAGTSFVSTQMDSGVYDWAIQRMISIGFHPSQSAEAVSTL